MKYYINDRLVRTSKNVYTHAVMCGDGVCSCHGNYELTVKAMNKLISDLNTGINNARNALAAIDNGKKTYPAKCYGHAYTAKIEWPRETYMEIIAKNEETKSRFHICELEVR